MRRLTCLFTLFLALSIPAVSHARNDCLAETLPNLVDGAAVEDLVERKLPASKSINKRKTVRLDTVSTHISGCKLTLTFTGELERKLLRDRGFTIDMSTTMRSADRCVLKGLSVDKVDIKRIPKFVDKKVQKALDELVAEKLANQCLDIADSLIPQDDNDRGFQRPGIFGNR